MKRSNKGFTLVELLAVIVIMGVLMMIAIPSISRVIENSRKDTFVDIAQSYANAAKTLWAADSLNCDGTAASALDDGDYYILINTNESARANLPVLVDQGGKSSWGNRDVNGFVRVHVETIDDDGESKRTTKFYVGLSDGTHGIIDEGSMTSDNIKRGNVKMDLSAEDKIKVELTNDTGALRCSKTNLGTFACSEVTPPKYISGICADDSSTAAYLGTIDVNPKTFATDSWTTISAAAKSGSYVGKYNVGDTKEIDLGSLGKHTIRIANTQTPSECRTSGFSKTACGFVLEFADIVSTHSMNSNNTNKGGWPASDMRAYINSEIYNSIPVELRNSIIDTKVVSGHGSVDTKNFTSTDKLYLLDSKEVYGSIFAHEASSVVQNERQLDYYANNNVTPYNYAGAIKKYNGTGTNWRLRSASSKSTTYFWYIVSDGNWSNANDASYTSGVSPAFRIA